MNQYNPAYDLRALKQAGVPVVSAAKLSSIDITTTDAPIAIVIGEDGAQSAPVFGYEIQFENQFLAEGAKNNQQDWLAHQLKGFGVVMLDSRQRRRIQENSRKVRQDTKTRQTRHMSERKKAAKISRLNKHIALCNEYISLYSKNEPRMAGIYIKKLKNLNAKVEAITNS